MKTVVAAAAALLLAASPAAAQDIAGPIAAAVDQFGQSMAESVAGGPGVFVTAQGREPMPAVSSAMIINIKGEGKTAAEAVAHRNAQLERVRSVANNFDVSIEVGATNYAISEEMDWAMTEASFNPLDAAAAAAMEAVASIEDDGSTAPSVSAEASMARTVTATVQVTIERPNETRLPAFVDALVEAGVTDLDDSLNGLNLGQLQPFLSLMGLDTTNDPGERVWNAATADGVARARAQAESIAAASGRQLGPVRYVSVLMRSHDGKDALVSVAVRFGFAD
ncbi:SIMPL domain-containing protein [Brevundimonas lenta]|uniref:Uncharacterized protein YggE n=1 Tax=Brevundimonas lenta TaxID=424796 RepID=A0A7W6JH13_9CAUL|nr:SIMPL domain-containing protein [Brevundimonas lenta]MBB4083967.1 uncharacterized protein YggE [Brevundimonas lenta]